MKFLKLTLLLFCFLLSSTKTFSQYNVEKYISDAKSDLISNHFTEAIKKLNICIQVEPTAYEAFYYRGVCKYYLNDNLGAKNDLDIAMSVYNSWYYDACHYRAIVKDRLEDFSGAIQDYNKVIEKKSDNPQLYLERSFSRLSGQDYNGAIRDCNKALSMQFFSEELYLCKGAAEGALNDYESALQDFNKVLSINPKNQNAYVRRGMVKAKTGNAREAIEDYDTALKIDSGCTFAYYNRASARMELKDDKGAIEDYTSLLKYEPTNALAFFNRAALEANMNQFKKALADFNQVLLLNPDNIQALFNRAKMKQATNDYKGALSDYDKTIELYPYFTEAYYERSLLKKSEGDYKGAKHDFDLGKMMSEMNHAKNSSQIARDSVTLTHLTELNADFNNVNQNTNDSVDIQLMPIYYLAYKDSNYKSMAGSRPVVLKSKRQDYHSFFLTNKELRLRSPVNDSIVAFQDSTNSEHEVGLEVLLNRAIKKTILQLFNDAEKDYDKIIALDPASPISYFSRGINACREVELLNHINDDLLLPGSHAGMVKNQKDEIYQKALSDFNKTIQLEPGFAFAFFNRAYVKCQLRDFNGAVKDYDNAIKTDPSLADAYYNRGLFLLYLKAKAEACADFSKAGELGLTESYAVIKKYCPRSPEK